MRHHNDAVTAIAMIIFSQHPKIQWLSSDNKPQIIHLLLTCYSGETDRCRWSLLRWVIQNDVLKVAGVLVCRRDDGKVTRKTMLMCLRFSKNKQTLTNKLTTGGSL